MGVSDARMTNAETGVRMISCLRVSMFAVVHGVNSCLSCASLLWGPSFRHCTFQSRVTCWRMKWIKSALVGRGLGLTRGSCMDSLAAWSTSSLPPITMCPGTQMNDTFGASWQQVVSRVRMR